VRWYAALLQDLKQHHFESYSTTFTSGIVRDLPVKNLRLVLEDWILSQFREDRSGLIPYLALATGDLIRKLIEGYSGDEPEPWQFDALFGEEFMFGLGQRRFDKEFKKRFTENTRLEVVARVPDGLSLSYQGRVLLESGDNFRIQGAAMPPQ
jgi:hypothetical protein